MSPGFATPENDPRCGGSFSVKLPGLQVAWDSVSMGALKTCPRKYQLSIIEGWTARDTSVHLIFGLHYHAALEHYDHYKSQGQSHEAALLGAVRYVLEATWDRELGRPWLSDNPNKNRATLLRTVVWYLEQFAEDPLKTVILADGKPAVELSFRIELGVQTRTTDEHFLLSGHIDRLVTMNDRPFPLDRKTTKSALAPSYFEQYSPDNQFSGYIFAGKVMYSLPIKGIIVDAAQIGATFTRFQRGIVHRQEATLEEWYNDYKVWLRFAEEFARAGHWPMNDKACHHYGGCEFRSVCAKSPLMRREWLMRQFTKRVWDPLQVRGDI